MDGHSPLIRHSRPCVGPEEVHAVSEVLASGHHARGSKTTELESALAATVQLARSHATTSGTAALELALRAVGAAPGKSVLIPSLTCAAVWNAIRNTGAYARMYDGAYEMSAAAETLRGQVGQDCCAIVVVAPMHRPGDLVSGGYEPDRDGMASIAGVPVLLDRCQQLAPGPSSGLRARAEIFSFYATKCISTGMGGAIASNDRSLMERVIDMNTHDGRDDYASPRFNYQFDDIRAAIGQVQLRRLGEFQRRRQELAAVYYDALVGSKVVTSPPSREGMVFRFLADCGSLGGAEALISHLRTSGIEAKRPVFRPLHRYAGDSDADFPEATAAWERTVSLPLYPALEEEELRRVIDAVLRWR